MERGRQEGRSSGAGSVIEEEFGECGEAVRLGGRGPGFGGKRYPPGGCQDMLSYGSQAPLSRGQAPWTLASFWALRGSMVLSRAPHPKTSS